MNISSVIVRDFFLSEIG